MDLIISKISYFSTQMSQLIAIPSCTVKMTYWSFTMKLRLNTIYCKGEIIVYLKFSARDIIWIYCFFNKPLYSLSYYLKLFNNFVFDSITDFGPIDYIFNSFQRLALFDSKADLNLSESCHPTKKKKYCFKSRVFV